MLTTQRLDKTLLQHTFQQLIVRLHISQLIDRTQSTLVLHHLPQQLLRRAARDRLALMAVAVAIDTAVATVGSRILIATAFIKRLEGRFKHLQQRLRRAHQLFQITRTSGHTVIDHQIATWVVRTGGHSHIQRDSQVINRPTESPGQT
ncbi:hypothetical protein FQZ97_949350 [compost metagenome]